MIMHIIYKLKLEILCIAYNTLNLYIYYSLIKYITSQENLSNALYFVTVINRFCLYMCVCNVCKHVYVCEYISNYRTHIVSLLNKNSI